MNRHMPKIQHLVDKKKEQTLAKHRRLGFANEDDYGNILPPEDFQFTFPVLDDDGSFHGVNAWAENFKALLDAHPVYSDDDDVLAGKWMFIMARMRPGYLLHKSPYPFDYSHLHPEQELYDITHGIGKDAHFAPDYRIGLSLGFGGLYEKVKASLSLLEGDPEAEELLNAEFNVISAIQSWIARTAEITTGEKRRSNQKLITDPPETMLEACRWIAWFSMAGRVYNRGGSGARLDDILLPYYEKDTASGLIDDDDAVYYLACLLLNETRYYQIGGDGGNKVSYLILEAAHLIKSTCNLTICVNSKADDALFRRGVEILVADKLGYPRFANGQALAEGFSKNGYPLELAKQRIAAGCHWMSLEGREYTLNDVVKINLAKVFDVAFHEGNTTEKVYQRFLTHLEKAVLCVAKGIDFHLDHQYLNEPELILNLICHNTIEKGRDITHGGADFYNMCCDGAGIATVADSFAALETRVEKESRLTWRECKEAVDSNYQCEHGEDIRALLNTTKKFGYGGCSADTWAVRIMRDFTKIVKARPNSGRAHYDSRVVLMGGYRSLW